MIYNKFVKQIYLNTLISNKLRYADHFDIFCIMADAIQCAKSFSFALLTIYDHVV